jgi:hypothetical protein
MEFKISACKSCDKEISLNTKTCPNCGDIDPFNKKAIKKLLRILITKDNFLQLIKGAIVFCIISFAIYFSWGKSWYYWIVFILIGTFLNSIILDEEGKYFGKPFMQERLKFSDLIQESLEKFIKANQEKLQSDYRYSKDNHYYLNILEAFWDCVIDQNKSGGYGYIIRFSERDWKNIINNTIKSTKKK